MTVEDLNVGNLGEDNMEIDESKPGESWVLGLAEGEYSDLSVEERLNALVVLVGVANEGNSIRVVLEVNFFPYNVCIMSLSYFLYFVYQIDMRSCSGSFGSSKCSEETNVGRITSR